MGPQRWLEVFGTAVTESWNQNLAWEIGFVLCRNGALGPGGLLHSFRFSVCATSTTVECLCHVGDYLFLGSRLGHHSAPQETIDDRFMNCFPRFFPLIDRSVFHPAHSLHHRASALSGLAGPSPTVHCTSEALCAGLLAGAACAAAPGNLQLRTRDG